LKKEKGIKLGEKEHLKKKKGTITPHREERSTVSSERGEEQ
jgi:hypothetical protein